MESYKKLKEYRLTINETTSKQFPELIVLFEQGYAILENISEILAASYQPLNPHTKRGASEWAAWRFLSTLPSSASWCFETALCGDYGISKGILRLTLEETVKLAFYVSFEEKALRQVENDRATDEISVSKMLAMLDFQPKNGIMSLHGELSAFYSHANLNIPVEIDYSEPGKKPIIGGGPRYEPILFEPIAQQLLLLIINAIKYLIIRFPILQEDQIYEMMNIYSNDVAEVLPDLEE